MNTPKLRFKEFTGEWKKIKLGKLVTIKKGSGLSKADLSEDGEPCILYGQIYTKYGPVIRTVISKTNIILKNPIIGKNNDVLIPSSGETAFDIACATCLDVDDVIIGGDINILTPSKDINGHFLSYQINSAGKKVLSTYAQGASVVHLYSEAIKKLDCNLPKLEEQIKIADFITKLNQRIEKQSEKVTLLHAQKNGLLRKIFSQAIRFKDDNGEEFPQWSIVKFLDVFKSISTRQFQILNTEILTQGKYEVVDQGHHRVAGYSNEVERLFSNGPAIIYGDHTTYVKYRNKPFIIGADGTKILISNSNDVLEYLYYALSHHNIKPEGYKRHYSIIKNIKLPLPINKEQQKIADFLFLFDSKIENEVAKLESLKMQKKGYMQHMFL